MGKIVAKMLEVWTSSCRKRDLGRVIVWETMNIVRNGKIIIILQQLNWYPSHLENRQADLNESNSQEAVYAPKVRQRNESSPTLVAEDALRFLITGYLQGQASVFLRQCKFSNIWNSLVDDLVLKWWNNAKRPRKWPGALESESLTWCQTIITNEIRPSMYAENTVAMRLKSFADRLQLCVAGRSNCCFDTLVGVGVNGPSLEVGRRIDSVKNQERRYYTRPVPTSLRLSEQKLARSKSGAWDSQPINYTVNQPRHPRFIIQGRTNDIQHIRRSTRHGESPWRSHDNSW